MQLIGLSFVRITLGALYVSIAVIIIYILYKRLLRYLNKDVPEKVNYCELSSLESNPAKGELEFYFTANEKCTVVFEILNANYAVIEQLLEKEYEAGQHIIRYDSTQLTNGSYYYQLRTANQQTMKKMNIEN
jgi:hypothetical protein